MQFLKFLSSKQERPEKSTVEVLTGMFRLKQELYLPARLQTDFWVPLTCRQQDFNCPLVNFICRRNSSSSSSRLFFLSSFITSSSKSSLGGDYGQGLGSGSLRRTPVRKASASGLEERVVVWRGFGWVGCLRDLRELLRTASWALARRLERESLGYGGGFGGQFIGGGVGLDESYSYSGVSISLRRRVMAKFFWDKN